MRTMISSLAMGSLLTLGSPVVAQQAPGQQAAGQQAAGQQAAGQQAAGQQAAGQNGQLQRIPQQAQQSPQEKVVATVNGQPITEPEFNATVQQRLQQLQMQAQAQGQQLGPDAVQAARQESLDLLIESRLVEEHAVEKGPEVQSEEVETAIDGLKQQLQAQQVSLEEFLASRGYTKDSLEKRIEGSLAWQKLQQQEITPENLQQFFQQNQEQFRAESIDQVPQQQLAQSYASVLWGNIVEQKKENADIEVLKPEVVGAPQTSNGPGAQQQAAPAQGNDGFSPR